MKEKESEREREEWSKEILSDKNPNLINFYKQKLEKKEEKIADLKKQIRKYALGEKRVFIKEKAFELERAEYQDKMTYLQERVSKLSKINDDYKKSKDEGKDRYRRKREANLNKSQTSSDDNMESKPGGGLGTEPNGTTIDSYISYIRSSKGETQKVYFHNRKELLKGMNEIPFT